MTDIHVSPSGGDVSGDGSASTPFRSIAAAIAVQENGDRVVVAPGEYTEDPLIVVGIEQGRLSCPEPGGARISFPALSASDGSGLAIRASPRYVVEGLSFAPVTVTGAVAGTFGLVVMDESDGAMVTDLAIAGLSATAGAVNGALAGVFVFGTRHARVERCRVEAVTASYDDSTAAGILASGSSVRVGGGAIQGLSGTRAAGVVCFAGSVGATGLYARIEGTSFRDIAGEDFSAAVLIEAEEDPILTFVRNVQAVLVQGSGLWLAGLGRADVRGLVAFRCGQGIDVRGIGNGSRFDGLTFHQCETGIRSDAPNPPAIITVRNASFSGTEDSPMGTAIEALGDAGTTLFDVDYVNLHEVDRWWAADAPLEASFLLGSHITEYRPLYVSPDLAAVDFTPEIVSGIVNRGGEV